MKTILKMLALVATLVGLASCGSSPASNLTETTKYLDPGPVTIDGK